MTINKVNLNLSEINGNAFSLMSAFNKAAKREGWTDQEIETVLTECKKGDYDHLLQTLLKNIR